MKRFEGPDVPQDPRVSIVTPCFNGEPFIAAALESVEALPAELRVEHVVSDGGSRDGTVDRLARAPRVRGVSRPDNGVYEALNRALAEARGRFVQWLNADDELPGGFLARAIPLLESDESIDFVLGDTQFLDEEGRPLYRWTYDLARALDLEQQARGYFFNLNSAVFRRRALLEVGTFDQERFPLAADRDVELRLVVARARGLVLDMPAYRFRIQPGSLTSGSGARERSLTETIRLFESWSHRPAVPPSAGLAFALRAQELRLGLALKALRRPGGRREALLALSRAVLRAPAQAPRALLAWLRHRRAGDLEPMRRA